MGMDLGGGFGAGGAVAGLQQLIAQRFLQRRQDELVKQQGVENEFKNRALQQADDLKRAQIAEVAQAAKDRTEVLKGATADRQMGLAHTLGDQIPAGATMGLNDPAVGLMQQGGLGSLLTAKGIQSEAPPASIAAPDQPTGDIPGTIANSPYPAGRLLTKGASQAQNVAALTEQDRKSAEARQEARDAETVRHNQAVENKAPKDDLIPIQTVDENGEPETRIVSKRAGDVYKKPPSAVTANRLDSAKAVVQTGNDIIKQLSNPETAAQVGVAMSRYNNVLDFFGNPPPEFAHLAGQIESYSLANMGVHGMRSANGADAIKATIGQGRHTPETIMAVIRGLNGFSNHFLENAGRTAGDGASASGNATKKTAADLIKQYGGTP
jgi:hypothetical protein